MNREELKKLHDPVLLDKALEIIDPKVGESYLDLTAGYGGHAEAFLQITKNFKEASLVDRDNFAISNLNRFAELGANIVHGNFYQAAFDQVECSNQFDIVFMDLGVSSPQLDSPERGFSFAKDGPLDMRMDRRQTISAYDIVNKWSEDDLVHIFVKYGEEKPGFARSVAREIIRCRPIQKTVTLADIIKSKSRFVRSRTHPATRFFQAIRIVVNNELVELEKTLNLLPRLLKPGGRVGVISFHSLEDRIVKNYFIDQSRMGLEASLIPITKKPIQGEIYDVNNPRARSAKLRVAVKK